MKKKYKIVTIILVTILTLAIISTNTIATTLSELNEPARSDFNNIGNAFIQVLTTIGIVLSVIVLIVIGIKYMLGSLEERAEYKRTLLPYVIGAGLVFSASTIAQIIYKFANNL